MNKAQLEAEIKKYEQHGFKFHEEDIERPSGRVYSHYDLRDFCPASAAWSNTS